MPAWTGTSMIFGNLIQVISFLLDSIWAKVLCYCLLLLYPSKKPFFLHAFSVYICRRNAAFAAPICTDPLFPFYLQTVLPPLQHYCQFHNVVQLLSFYCALLPRCYICWARTTQMKTCQQFCPREVTNVSSHVTLIAFSWGNKMCSCGNKDISAIAKEIHL